jgi:ornithine cyclodeaminase/alanine dehydrogenase-like protein (mu-crystallin family)
MQVFDTASTAAALPFERLIPALREAYTSGAEVPPRQVLQITEPSGATAFTSLIMPAWLPGRAYGVKVINIAPGNATLGLPGLHASYLLHDAHTGVPIALIEGNELTARRTAAASALAASYLARANARHLLVVGAGRIAALLPAAYRCVRPIDRVTVWARRLPAAQLLVEKLAAQGFDAHASTDLALSAAQADVVSCATLATEPVVHGRWLPSGSHLDLIGSFTPAMREADDDCFRHARLFVGTEEALVKSGELLGPMARSVFSANDVQGTLSTLCRSQRPGRRNATERTVFKSVGSALEDLAAAMLVVQASAD